MLIRLLSVLLGLAAAFFFGALIISFLRHRREDPLPLRTAVLYALAEGLVWLLATFGVSDTAINLVLYRIGDTVDTRRLPSTIVMGALVPLCIMSISYMNAVEVDPTTLIVLILLQSIGGFAGASIVKKLNIRMIRTVMGVALIATSVFLFARLFLLHMEGGTAIGLSPLKLVIAGLILMFMEALVMVGFGNIPPALSLLLMLGMSPASVYPVVMTASAFGIVVGCAKFLKDGFYHRRIALIEAVTGTIGVVLAVRLASSMSSNLLQVLMMLLMLYSAWNMFRDNAREKKKQA